MTKIMWLILFFVAFPCAAQQITLTAPAQAAAGATIEITWSGGENPKDFITIVKKDAPEGSYKKYKYARVKSWKAQVPETPGDYEVRYLSADRPYPTLAHSPLTITPVSATLQVPATASAGSRFQVSWTGPGNNKDFITIVPKGTPERGYKKYQYTRKGNPLELPAPEEPGDYEVRYLTGQSYFTLATAPIRVTAVTASVQAPDKVLAGDKFSVTWRGPDNQRDFITIVKADAPEKSYGKYVYTRRGSPIQLPAPDEPGAYEVRYLTGEKSSTLARTAIEVTAASASLKFEPSAAAGSMLSVQWTGPDNQGDYLTIVRADAPVRSYGRYRYTARGNPLNLPVPEVPDDYEVRYLTGQKGLTLFAAPLKVNAVTASLEASSPVKGGTSFEVTWSGPDNAGDYIAIVPSGAPVHDYKEYRYTRRGNPAVLRAPMEKGDYMLHYLTGRKNIVLASRALVVDPPDVLPGFLQVNLKAAFLTETSGNAVEVILDASGSMLQRLDGKRRIDIAKQVLVDLTRDTLPAGAPFALRVFGHREADSCRTDLEVPLSPLEPRSIAARIKKIQAMNKAKTPIARSLELVAQDLPGVSGQRIVILITDGEETCGGDPAEAIEALKAAGVDVRLNIVGFAIQETDLKQAFRNWADLGDGHYFDAGDAAQLGRAMGEALQTPFQVIDAEGKVVTQGLAGGEPIRLPPGIYKVAGKTPSSPTVEVEIKSGKTTVTSL